MSQSVEQKLTQYFEKAFIKGNYDPSYAQVQISSRPELSDFQCNGAMPLTKYAKKAPFMIAEEIVSLLDDDFAQIAEASVVKPGFINIRLKDDFLARLSNQQATNERLECPTVSKQKSVVIDFGGPNVAKPMHVGHIRSTLLGDCLQRVYRFCGDKVVSDVHLGDWGTQMGMLIDELKLMYPDLPYFDENFTGEYPSESPVTVKELAEIYPRASVRCKSDAAAMESARQATAALQKGRRGYRALWQHFVNVSKAELKKDFESLGVYFDLWKGESDVQALIEPLVADLSKRGVAVESEGAIVIPVAENDEDNIPPLILVKSDGAVMYGTTDLATIVDRINAYNADKIIYVVDKRQALHFKQVFAAAERSGLKVNMEHIGFGTVNGKDGRPFKTRTGGVMHLSTLIDEAKTRASLRNSDDIPVADQQALVDMIAMATVKFADLANSYTSDYIFDLDKFSQYEGKTGPYLLYSAVRIKSILRKVGYQGEQYQIMPATNNAERNLQLMFTQLPTAIERTYRRCEPHHLCEYAFQLATAFNKFYNESPIASENDVTLKQGRIALALLTLKHLELVLDLLGIEIPERM